MSGFTRIGTSLWDWERWQPLSCEARNLVLAFLTCADAKRLIPGLYHGPISGLVENARMGAVDGQRAFNELVEEQHLIEFDRRTRVMRLVELPDRGERPSNGRVLQSWWTRFGTVPECGVRNAHIETLQWLASPMSQDVADRWSSTFGTVSLHPLNSRTRVKRSRPAGPQPDLFTSTDMRNGIGKGIAYPLDPDPDLDQDLVQGEVQEGGTAPSPPAAHLAEAPLFALQAAGAEPAPPDARALPFTVAALLDALQARSGGRFLAAGFDRRLASSITAAIRGVAEAGYGMADVEALGDWWAAGGMGWRDDLGPKWVSVTGNLVEAVARAARWSADGRPAQQRARPVTAGVAPPAPAAAFQSGRRKL